MGLSFRSLPSAGCGYCPAGLLSFWHFILCLLWQSLHWLYQGPDTCEWKSIGRSVDYFNSAWTYQTPPVGRTLQSSSGIFCCGKDNGNFILSSVPGTLSQQCYWNLITETLEGFPGGLDVLITVHLFKDRSLVTSSSVVKMTANTLV